MIIIRRNENWRCLQLTLENSKIQFHLISNVYQIVKKSDDYLWTLCSQDDTKYIGSLPTTSDVSKMIFPVLFLHSLRISCLSPEESKPKVHLSGHTLHFAFIRSLQNGATTIAKARNEEVKVYQMCTTISFQLEVAFTLSELLPTIITNWTRSKFQLQILLIINVCS